ncbi:MAG: winged helix-turn-helix transcriptional regulator [archaeon]|nr:winged helix-turn-helix transcriptional regulator [archaeon]
MEEPSAGSLETKDRILQYIQSHPGSHLRQIRRDLNISMGVVQYHLYALEKERKILSRRSSLYKRFYPTLTFSEHQQEVLDVLSQETERDLLIYLLHNPNATQKELSEYAQISPGTINWHMKRLISSTLIRARREGQFVRYKVNGETEEILKLVRGYHPSTLVSWADRFANAINEVSPDMSTKRKEKPRIEDSKEEDKK